MRRGLRGHCSTVAFLTCRGNFEAWSGTFETVCQVVPRIETRGGRARWDVPEELVLPLNSRFGGLGSRQGSMGQGLPVIRGLLTPAVRG